MRPSIITLLFLLLLAAVCLPHASIGMVAPHVEAQGIASSASGSGYTDQQAYAQAQAAIAAQAASPMNIAAGSTMAGSPLVSTSSLNTTLANYQPLGDYLTNANAALTYQPVGSYLTPAGAAAVYQPLGSYLTTTGAAATYQPIGSYATTAALNSALAPLASTSYVTSAIAAIPSNTIAGGPFTVNSATTPQNPLPTCTAALLGKVAAVSDLGGGPDNVVCSGGAWKNIRLGTPATNATCGSVTITPLVSAPVQQMTCTAQTSGASINISATNLAAGEEFYVITPSTLGGVLSSLPVSVGGVSTTMTVVAATKYHYLVTAALGLLQLSP